MNLTFDRPFHLQPKPGRTGGYKLRAEPGHEPPEPPSSDRLHPLTRLMALAIEAKRLIDHGTMTGAAEMARVAGVTRARMTQVLNLTLLAPDIQEMLLFLPMMARDASLDERRIRKVCAVVEWEGQRKLMRGMGRTD